MPILYPLSGPSATESEGDGSPVGGGVTVGKGEGEDKVEGVPAAEGEGVTSEGRLKEDADSTANITAASISSAKTINVIFSLGLIIIRTC